MRQHVKENMRDSSNEATEIDGSKRILDFFGKEPEKTINSKNSSFKAPLNRVDEQTHDNWIDCQHKEIAVPQTMIRRSAYQKCIK